MKTILFLCISGLLIMAGFFLFSGSGQSENVQSDTVLAGTVQSKNVQSENVHVQTFTADFSRWSGPPLVKTKFGVYQTPFLPLQTISDSFALLREAGVQDFRYEMAWGKPGVQAYDQISGTAANPIINFAPIDGLANGLKAAGVTPLFAMTYDPLPLKTGDDRQRWKDVPSDLDSWSRINQSYAAHYCSVLGLKGPFYEVWNEPDLPGDGGKVFFNGSPDDYAKVYAPAHKGLAAGDPDALIGGPGMAFNTDYVEAALKSPMDFVSIHAYVNYADQIHNVRRFTNTRPELPFFLTEYASYKDFGRTAPISRAEAAPRFFSDVRGLLNFPDATKVYWAQWADDDLGMLTHDLHRKALYNALKIYQTLLPVDRNPITPEAENGVNAMASSDDHCAAIVIWNDGDAPKPVAIRFTHLPFASGSVSMSQIDSQHASYVDNPTTENLATVEVGKVASHEAVWTGTVTGHGVVLLRATDQTSASLLDSAHIGTYIRPYWWFPDRNADCYADYDPRTCIARLGMGTRDANIAQIGIVMDKPAPRLQVQVKRQGAFAHLDTDSLFGVRVDYKTAAGWARSVLWHDGSYNPKRASVLPWGKGAATADKAIAVPALAQENGGFTLDIKGNAPAGWNGRILLTPILQNRGANSSARLILRPAR